jgi:beta-barrel assembly-enhancing protease
MKRRRLLAAGAWCCAGACAPGAWGQALNFTAPGRLGKPDTATDEGGLWAMMDREERNLRRSPFLLRDAALNSYIQDMVCRLAKDHCPDLRVYLVRTPVFNASMAPNGMMQIWTGLLLRADNEAQLAAVIGHEIGHYLQRHSLDRLRDIKDRAALAQVVALFGLVGAFGQLAIGASAFAYGREHEREADRIGAVLMHRAGYDVAEAAKVWGNLVDEVAARDGKEPEKASPLFASHPSSPERRETLETYAGSLPGGITGSEAYATQTQRFLDGWLNEEVKRGQHAQSLVLLSRLLQGQRATALLRFYRGEVYRLRGESGDLDNALVDYRSASQAADAPPAAFRGIGLIARQRGQHTEAIESLGRYLQLAPDAPDSPFIKSYLSELQS